MKISVISLALAGATLASAIASMPVSAQATPLVRWDLKDVTPFEDGQTASGYFSINQETGEVADWNIKFTGGNNSTLTNVIFNNDKDCLVACVRTLLFNDSKTTFDFRTPLAADNTYFEFPLYILGSKNKLTFPQNNDELMIQGVPANGATNLQYNLYIGNNTVMGLQGSSLFTEEAPNARIIYSSAVPEPLTILGSGIALGFGGFLKRKLGKHQKD